MGVTPEQQALVELSHRVKVLEETVKFLSESTPRARNQGRESRLAGLHGEGGSAL